jgi:type IV secretion system protein VirD4
LLVLLLSAAAAAQESDADKYRNPLGGAPAARSAPRAAPKAKPDLHEMVRRGASQDELWDALQRGGPAAARQLNDAINVEVEASRAKIELEQALAQARARAAIEGGSLEGWVDPLLPEWVGAKYPDLSGATPGGAVEALVRRGAGADADKLSASLRAEAERRAATAASEARARAARGEVDPRFELPTDRLGRDVKQEFADDAWPWWLEPLSLFGGFVLFAIGYAVWDLMRERRYRALAVAGAVSCAGLWWSVAAVRHALKDQYGHTVQSVAMVIALIAGVVACFFTWKLLVRPSVRKLKPDLLIEGQKGVLAECTRAGDGSVWAGQVEGQDIYVTAEDRAVVIGPPGTGKTAFLVSQLLAWAEQKRSFVCLDSKPEIFAITRRRLEAQGYRVLSYNPTSRTGQRYNMFRDLVNREGRFDRVAIREIAAVFIPANDERNRVFADGARDLFDAIATHLDAVEGEVSFTRMRNWAMQHDSADELLKELLKSPNEEVQELASSISKRAVSDRLMASIFSAYDSGLTFVSLPEIRESASGSDFSLHDLCTGEPVALFLQFEESEREVTEHYLAAIVAHLLRFMILHTERPPVLLMLDEIGSVPVIPALPQKLNTIRSRNLPTWLYWQSLEQMQKYGEKHDEGPNLILGATDVKVMFRLEDNNTAEWMSDRIGKIDRVIESVSTKFGDMAQHSRQLSLEPMVFPRQLMELRPGEVVCSYRGHTWRGRATPHFERYPEFKGARPAEQDKRGPSYGRASGIAPAGEAVRGAAVEGAE